MLRLTAELLAIKKSDFRNFRRFNDVSNNSATTHPGTGFVVDALALPNQATNVVANHTIVCNPCSAQATAAYMQQFSMTPKPSHKQIKRFKEA